MCAPSIELYALTISRGPGSVIGKASGGEESMTNKPLVTPLTAVMKDQVSAEFGTICRTSRLAQCHSPGPS